MTYSEILLKLNEAASLEKEKVEEAVKKFNDKMESAKIEFQKQNRDGEILASQARLTT